MAKSYANDPQATIKQRRKNREKAREKADKRISDISLAGGYAITALGGLGLSMAYKARHGGDSKKYYNSTRTKTMQKPRNVLPKVQSPDMK
jgi:hypothetical protein